MVAAYAARRRELLVPAAGLEPRRGGPAPGENGGTPPLPESVSAIASLTLVAPGIVSRVDLPWRTKVAVGACALGQGVFQGRAVISKTADAVLPVQVYIPGCPPKPEAVTAGLGKLIKLIRQNPDR